MTVKDLKAMLNKFDDSLEVGAEIVYPDGHTTFAVSADNAFEYYNQGETKVCIQCFDF